MKVQLGRTLRASMATSATPLRSHIPSVMSGAMPAHAFSAAAAPVTHDVQALHIARIVVHAHPGTDRAALARALAQRLPQAIVERLRAGASASGSPAVAMQRTPALDPSLTQRVADAVARRVQEQGR